MLSRFEVWCPPTSLDAGTKSPFPLVTAKTISTKSEALPERSSLAETMMLPGSQALVTARHLLPGPAHNFSWELALAFPESSVNTVIWIASKTIIKYQNAQGSQLKRLGHWTPPPHTDVIEPWRLQHGSPECLFPMVSCSSSNHPQWKCLQIFINDPHQVTHPRKLGVRHLSKQDSSIQKQIINNCQTLLILYAPFSNKIDYLTSKVKATRI